ncbi:MAG TPA: IS1380 family transposase [Casimicrobiaceae bacterium]|nr:IS1380 family transposase [Casimicrobiaceae bacterium]
MPNCNAARFDFPSFDRRKIEAGFTGGDVSSDGGVMLLREVDRKLGLCKALNRVIHDPRHPDLITHQQIDLLRQRIYGIALGYEDLNDHDTLRTDAAWQTAVEREDELASSPTLCRLENRAGRATAVALSRVLVEQFVASFAQAPAELILDFDATDDRVHGMQEGRSFHGYYGDWCFLPLYVFCGEQLLVSYLRPSNIDAARHAPAVLKLLVTRLRQAWPGVRIIFRGDSGFCRWKMLRWGERHGVDYIVGVAKNARLLRLIEGLGQAAAAQQAAQKQKARLFGWIDYAAHTWDRPRRLIAKAEHGEQGANPRFVVTSLAGDAQVIYDTIYCARGEMENRIKEQQLGLFADRTSCHHWWANQFRLLLSSAAYVLVEAIRRLGLQGTELCKAQVTTIRLKLLKIGTVILRNTRRIRLFLSSAHPYQELFALVARRLNSA